MAKITVAAVFGVLVGITFGALQTRAQEPDLESLAADAGVDPVALAGALNSQEGVSAREYLESEGLLKPLVPFGVWDRLAMCESHGNWAANTGNGYWGGLQFALQTWRAYGGTGLPSQASRATQISVAERLRADMGYLPWPVCSRVVGLR